MIRPFFINVPVIAVTYMKRFYYIKYNSKAAVGFAR
jgi:hypothetical protein